MLGRDNFDTSGYKVTLDQSALRQGKSGLLQEIVGNSFILANETGTTDALERDLGVEGFIYNGKISPLTPMPNTKAFKKIKKAYSQPLASKPSVDILLNDMGDYLLLKEVDRAFEVSDDTAIFYAVIKNMKLKNYKNTDLPNYEVNGTMLVKASMNLSKDSAFKLESVSFSNSGLADIYLSQHPGKILEKKASISHGSTIDKIKHGLSNIGRRYQNWKKKHPNTDFAIKMVVGALVVGLAVGLAFAFFPPLLPVGVAAAKYTAGVLGLKSIAVVSGVGLHVHFGALIGLTTLGVTAIGTALGSIAFAIERLFKGGKASKSLGNKNDLNNSSESDTLDEVVVDRSPTQSTSDIMNRLSDSEGSNYSVSAAKQTPAPIIIDSSSGEDIYSGSVDDMSPDSAMSSASQSEREADETKSSASESDYGDNVFFGIDNEEARRILTMDDSTIDYRKSSEKAEKPNSPNKTL